VRFLSIFIIPVILGLVSLCGRRTRLLGLAHACGYLLIIAAAGIIFFKTVFLHQTLEAFNFFFLDGLSAFFLAVIAMVGFSASLYSIGYIQADIDKGILSIRKSQLYYLLFDLFLLSMIMVVSVNNLGMLWVCIEMTTLVSAFLVGFYRTKESLEAAWKYIIVCSVGIILALLGTILFSYALSFAAGPKSLNWTDMIAYSQKLDKNILKIAFIFILVGYGTKAGLAPMHTWLPDAHSQAISPISALLSGVLLKTAVYAIIRFGMIVNQGLGSTGYFSHLLTIFGLVCLVIAAGFIIAQKDLKRLLAYSSIEHIGIICLGLGIGGGIACLGVLAHIFNHAAAKSLMFFGAGNIVKKYEQHNMRMIRGVVESMPFTGIMFLLGTFALTGFPPFSLFFSELLLIVAGFLKGAYIVTGLLLFFLALIFSAMISHFSRMLFGHAPKGMLKTKEPLGAKAAFVILLAVISISGLSLAWIYKPAVLIAQQILKGI